MELEYKTEEQVINFFKDRAGSREVLSICQSLIPRGNVQEAEINHVRKILHKLKTEGYLLVQNEGENIFEEKFSSTPDRLKKYFEAVSRNKNYNQNKNTNDVGSVSFDYSSNEHTYVIGESDMTFGIRFSGASQNSIYVYNDHPTIRSLALVKGVDDIDQVNLNRKYDGTSRTRCPEIGQIVLLKNVNNKYALIQILSIKMESRGDDSDEVKFKFKILRNSFNDIIAESENVTSTKNFQVSKIVTDDNIGIMAGGPITAGGDIIVNSNKTNPISNFDMSYGQKFWYEKPIGILLLMVVGGLILAGLIFYLGWN